MINLLCGGSRHSGSEDPPGDRFFIASISNNHWAGRQVTGAFPI